MVILLCSTPRRGMIAVATHGTPRGYTTSNSKRAVLFAPSSPIGGRCFQADSNNYAGSYDNIPNAGLLKSTSRDIISEHIEEKRRHFEENLLVSEENSTIDDHVRGFNSMTATPTYGHSCFPFAVNCRFSKTFFGVPKKCGYCQKIIVGTGFACQNCRFRCHKKCIMIGCGPQVCLRPKPCSLSRLPPGDEALINKLLKESEINSNDIDSVFVECENEEDETGENDAVSDIVTNGNLSRRQSRPSLANSSSIVAGMRSMAPSLTTSDEPSSSPPSPPSVSPSASNPSSPTYPSSVITDCSSASRQLRPQHRQRRQQRPHHRQQHYNTLLLALASGIERRPSSSSTSSFNQRQTPTPSPASLQPPASSSLVDRFLKLIPSWTGGVKEDNEQKRGTNDHSKTTQRSCSIISAASSASMTAYSSVGEFEKEAKSRLPRAVSASSAVATMTNGGSQRPQAHSACSTTSNSVYSAAGGVRTPVDEFNSSILEDLLAVSQAANNLKNTGCAKNNTTKSSQFLQRRLLWAKHMAGDRSARSQDCVISGNVLADGGLSSRDGRTIVRGRSATLRSAIRTGRSGVRGSGFVSKALFSNGRSETNREGRTGFECADDDLDETNDTMLARERLANTWPLFGLHINHDESDGQRADDVEIRSPECYDSSEVQECGEEDGLTEEMRQRQARLSDLGEWTISYSDLEFGECIHECRNMTTYKGRWHGDVMIHTFDMSGAESDRLMRSFLDDVRTLTKIRHENVALFMGASIDVPLVAVVTSIRKGCSLYDAVHVENRRISQLAKINIVRQVAQGMGYVHAKGIVLKTLTSKSIYLESKVKISMLDDGAPLKRHDVAGVGCVRRGRLTYISPELMQTLRVEPPALIVSGTPTKESDIYSFGTILFELYAGDFPFAHLAPETIVWTIGTGGRQDLERVRCKVAMKSLIEDCWSPDPTYRPSFTEVLKELQHTAALHKKHSSSVPDKLNKTGLHRSMYNY